MWEYVRGKMWRRLPKIKKRDNTYLKYIKYGSKKIGLTFGRITQKLLTLQQNGYS